MYITAKQGYELYAIYDTVSDKFVGVNLSATECAKIRSERYGESFDESYSGIKNGSFMNFEQLGKHYVDDNDNE